MSLTEPLRAELQYTWRMSRRYLTSIRFVHIGFWSRCVLNPVRKYPQTSPWYGKQTFAQNMQFAEAYALCEDASSQCFVMACPRSSFFFHPGVLLWSTSPTTTSRRAAGTWNPSDSRAPDIHGVLKRERVSSGCDFSYVIMQLILMGKCVTGHLSIRCVN